MNAAAQQMFGIMDALGRHSVRSLLSSEELCSKCSCVLQLEELQKVKIPTSIKVTPTRGGLLDNWD